jgi:DNA-binding NarL/FixJ family response regulator
MGTAEPGAGAPSHILIVDDRAVLAEPLALALRISGFDATSLVVSRSTGANDVLDHVRTTRPRTVVLGIDRGDAAFTLPLVGRLGDLRATVLLLGDNPDPALLASCLESGAAGVFDRSLAFEDLVVLVGDAATGRTELSGSARGELVSRLRGDGEPRGTAPAGFGHLTETEALTLRLLVAGRSAQEIATERGVAMPTVRSHIRGVLQKLGVNSQLAAVALARRAAWGRDQLG